MNQLELPLESGPSGPPPGTAARWSVRTFLILLILACLLPGVLGTAALFIQEYRASGAPTTPGTSGISHALALLALGEAGLCGISLGFAWFIGGRIVRSIQGLSSPAVALATGKAMPAAELHVKEAAEVAHAMAAAAELLQARTRSLEKSNAALAAREAELVEGQRLAKFGSWYWDPGTDELLMSRELRQLYGWEALTFQQLRGTRVSVEAWEEINAALQETMETGSGYALEVEILHDSGLTTWVHVKGEAVRGPGGDIVGARGILQDITERRQAQLVLQASEVRFQATFEQAAVGMAHISLDGRWLRINDKLCAIVGYGREELLQSTFQDITHADDLEESQALARRLLAGNIPNYSSERRYVRRDGSLVWVNVTVSLVRTPAGEPDYFIGVVEDIQPRREAETALEKARASHLQYLEQQVAERTAALTAANKELQAFTYAASHDLKSPLGRINNFSTLLETRYRERLEGDGLLFLKFIRTNATRMTILINDMLAHAQVEQQARNMQRIALPEAVQAVLREKTGDIQDSRAEISLDLPDLGVSADALAFRQVLRNLLENALKYSSRADPPRICIGAAAAGGRCRLWVRDNGVGFDMAQHDKIFEIFYRLHTFDQFPGSGIGLALVKKAMESMHGRVWAESQPGQGSVFFLELQLWPEGAPAAAAAAATSPAPAPGTATA